MSPRFLKLANIVHATRSCHGRPARHASAVTASPIPNVRRSAAPERDRTSSRFANAPEFAPATIVTRTKNERFTPTGRTRSTAGIRTRTRETINGSPIWRNVWKARSERGGACPAKARVIPGTSARDRMYRRAVETRALRTFPFAIEVRGTTAIADGTAAITTQPARRAGSGVRNANPRTSAVRAR